MQIDVTVDLSPPLNVDSFGLHKSAILNPLFIRRNVLASGQLEPCGQVVMDDALDPQDRPLSVSRSLPRQSCRRVGVNAAGIQDRYPLRLRGDLVIRWLNVGLPGRNVARQAIGLGPVVDVAHLIPQMTVLGNGGADDDKLRLPRPWHLGVPRESALLGEGRRSVETNPFHSVDT